MRNYTLFLNGSAVKQAQKYNTIEKYYKGYDTADNSVYVVDNKTGEIILNNEEKEEINEVKQESDKIVYRDYNGVYTKEYFIETGEKEEYYTLWKETTVDLRPQDEKGKSTNEGRKINYNRFGAVMDYFCHYRFVQNLSKTREGAIKKVKELGLKISDSKFSFELRHKGKPSFEAFGVRMQFKKEKWYGVATDDFFLAWKNNKEGMKKVGWSCWKYQNPRTGKETWYMSIKPNEKYL